MIRRDDGTWFEGTADECPEGCFYNRQCGTASQCEQVREFIKTSRIPGLIIAGCIVLVVGSVFAIAGCHYCGCCPKRVTDALCCNKKEEEPKETKEKESPYDFSNGGLKLKEGWEIVDG